MTGAAEGKSTAARGGLPPGAHGALHRFAACFGALYRVSLRATAWAALAGTGLLLLFFAAAWPAFTDMREGAEIARLQEDSYAPDTSDLWLVQVATAPLLLALLTYVSGGLHAAHSLAVTRAPSVEPDGLWRRVRRGAGRTARVQVCRAVLTAGLAGPGALLWSVSDVVLPAADPVLTYALPALLVPVLVALHVGLALAPAAAAVEGLGAIAALQRSWTLVRGVWRRTAVRVVTLVLLHVGVFVALLHAAEPADDAAHALAMWVGSGNTYLAYAAAQVAPVVVALPLSALVTLPFAHTVLTVLYERRVAEHGPAGGDAADGGAS